jgi:hypothetical protein
MVHSHNDVGLLVLGTPNQKFIVIRITSSSYIVNKPAEASFAHRLANIEERRFLDSTANSNFERYQTQSILGRKRGDNEVEGRLYDTVLEIRNADRDVRWGGGDDEDEVQWRVTWGVRELEGPLGR